jgi:transcriptional antiterminator RfaH
VIQHAGSDLPRWYAVRTQPRAEDRAQRNLEAQGFETFSPRIARSVRHARRTQWRLAPLFPGYMFVRLDASRQRWRPIDATFGVANIVKVAQTPAPLPLGLVEHLQVLAAETGELTGLESTIAIGDKVRVLGGAFDNWIGEVLSLPAPDRVMLLISMATREVKVTIPRKSAMLVEAASRQGPGPPDKDVRE